MTVVILVSLPREYSIRNRIGKLYILERIKNWVGFLLLWVKYLIGVWCLFLYLRVSQFYWRGLSTTMKTGGSRLIRSQTTSHSWVWKLVIQSRWYDNNTNNKNKKTDGERTKAGRIWYIRGSSPSRLSVQYVHINPRPRESESPSMCWDGDSALPSVSVTYLPSHAEPRFFWHKYLWL